MDTLILVFIATLFLGTSFEALIVSCLVQYYKIELDVNFEKEVKKYFL